jgi:hypothetical protein
MAQAKTEAEDLRSKLAELRESEEQQRLAATEKESQGSTTRQFGLIKFHLHPTSKVGRGGIVLNTQRCSPEKPDSKSGIF